MAGDGLRRDMCCECSLEPPQRGDAVGYPLHVLCLGRGVAALGVPGYPPYLFS